MYNQTNAAIDVIVRCWRGASCIVHPKNKTQKQHIHTRCHADKQTRDMTCRTARHRVREREGARDVRRHVRDDDDDQRCDAPDVVIDFAKFN